MPDKNMAPANCHHWHELSEEERRAVNDTSENPSFDYSIISVIDGLSKGEQELLDKCIVPDPSKWPYNPLQVKWIDTERRYLAWNTHRDPKEVTDIELIKDMHEKRTPCRYRLYYAAKRYLEGRPEAFKINLSNVPTNSLEVVADFFEDIRAAYDYNPLESSMNKSFASVA